MGEIMRHIGIYQHILGCSPVKAEVPFCQRCFVEILNKGGVVESFNLYMQTLNIAYIFIKFAYIQSYSDVVRG